MSPSPSPSISVSPSLYFSRCLKQTNSSRLVRLTLALIDCRIHIHNHNRRHSHSVVTCTHCHSSAVPLPLPPSLTLSLSLSLCKQSEATSKWQLNTKLLTSQAHEYAHIHKWAEGAWQSRGRGGAQIEEDPTQAAHAVGALFNESLVGGFSAKRCPRCSSPPPIPCKQRTCHKLLLQLENRVKDQRRQLSVAAASCCCCKLLLPLLLQGRQLCGVCSFKCAFACATVCSAGRVRGARGRGINTQCKHCINTCKPARQVACGVRHVACGKRWQLPTCWPSTEKSKAARFLFLFLLLVFFFWLENRLNC